MLAALGRRFVARINDAGGIEWSTYLGGTYVDSVIALSADAAGNVFVAGTAGYMSDILAAKYSADGRLLWTKTLGGNSFDTPSDLAVDSSENILIVGGTASTNFHVTPGAASVEQGDGFVVRMNPSGEIVWATYQSVAATSVAAEPDQSGLVAGANGLVRIVASGASVDTLDTIVPWPRRTN